jgi:hypothetical protein
MKFRIPRKLKKKLKKDFWLYPMDTIEKNYLVADPEGNQEDYDAYKRGELSGLKGGIKRRGNEKTL